MAIERASQHSDSEQTVGATVAEPLLGEVVRQLVNALQPEQIYLFGSRARGDSQVDSDYDFMVVLPDDTEMVLSGIRNACAHWEGVTLACHLNDPETLALADATGLTRSAAGIRLAARRYATPILVLGNAPTALAEAVRLIEEEGWRPAAIVGMPVGFVGVVEAKDRLLKQARVPYLTCVGRKGGSAVTAAAINALLDHELRV